MGLLGDLKLHFVHYPSFEVVHRKWIERVERVDLNNCCAVMVDRDGCTPEMAHRFDALPFEQKAFLSYRYIDGVISLFNDPDWKERGNNQTADLCAFVSPISARRKLDAFDWVDFFNKAGIYLG